MDGWRSVDADLTTPWQASIRVAPPQPQPLASGSRRSSELLVGWGLARPICSFLRVPAEDVSEATAGVFILITATAILSEWIEGKDDTLFSCRGFWDREGHPVVQHAARKLMQWPVEAGNMAALEIPRVEDWAEPLAIANRIFSSVKMFGIGAMEFKRAPDGRFLILEPCVGRTVYSHEIGPLNGFDVPWACYQYLATGGDLRETQPAARDGRVRLIDLSRARRAAQEYRRRGHFSEAEIRAVFAPPHLDMTHRRNDPIPRVLARARGLWRKARRLLGLHRPAAESDAAGG